MDLIEKMRRSPRPLLWDGGVGTALCARGLNLSAEPPEAWIEGHPELVSEVHAEFASAGADVVQTNSFGLLRLWLGGRPIHPATDYRVLARRSVELAQAGAAQRVGAPAQVVASLGPAAIAGVDSALLAARAGALAAAFAEAGAAGLHLETSYDPHELRALVDGIRSAAPQLPLLVSLTLTVGQSGLETPLGIPLSRLLSELERSLPDAVGVNCSLPARRLGPAVGALAEFCQRMERRTGCRLPLLAQPQIDQSAPDCKRPAVAETPERFATALLNLLDAGAAAVGGCCGCRGEHLRAVRLALDATDPRGGSDYKLAQSADLSAD